MVAAFLAPPASAPRPEPQRRRPVDGRPALRARRCLEPSQRGAARRPLAPAGALGARAPGIPAPRRRLRRPAAGVRAAGAEPGLRAGSEDRRLRSCAPPPRGGRPQARELGGLTRGSPPSGPFCGVSKAPHWCPERSGSGGESPAPPSREEGLQTDPRCLAATAS